jgi:hypothetical protein
VAFNITGPLLETKHGNKYVLVVINHYSKWCETKAVVDHNVETIVKFLEDEAICKFGVPNTFLAIMVLSGSQNQSIVQKLWHCTLVHCTPMAKVQWDGGKSGQNSQTWTHCFVYQS